MTKTVPRAPNTAVVISLLVTFGCCGIADAKTGMWGYGPEEVGSSQGSFFTGFLNAQKADPLFANDKAKLLFLINAASPLTGGGAPDIARQVRETTALLRH